MRPTHKSNCSAALSGKPNECDLNQFSSPAVAPNGRLYVGFENFNTPHENQYLVVSSSNGGSSWSAPAKVDLIHDINLPQSQGRDTVTGCAFRVAAPGNVAVDPSDPTGNTVQERDGGHSVYWGWIAGSNNNVPVLLLPPGEPVQLWAVWHLPGTGTTYLHADNDGRGYQVEKAAVTSLNLVYDRGTVFGLQTNARAESVLMSLPPLASWEYAPTFAPGSFEAELMAMLEPRDWVE